jgi:hypothetical protein
VAFGGVRMCSRPLLRADRYDDEEIDHIGRRMTALLDCVTRYPDVPLARLSPGGA